MSKLKAIDVDRQIKEYLLPTRIVAMEGNIDNAQSLLRKKPIQIGLDELELTTIHGESYIVLDFGKEIQGGVRILTHRMTGECDVRLRFGESVSETYSEIIGTSPNATATNDHSPRDFTAKLVFLSDLQFGNTGYRFLRIDFPKSTEIKLKSILGVFSHRPLSRLGKFECSDVLVNKIYNTAAYTVELCMQSMLWDGVKRDRLVWIGDMHPEVKSIMALYGEDECVELSLSFVRETTPTDKFMNNIPSYSLWWLCILSDYYLHNGNLSYIKAEKAHIVSLVDRMSALVDENGELVFTRYFLDWPSNDREERKAGILALCAFAMQKAKLLFNALELNAMPCDAIISRLNKTQVSGGLKQVAALQVFGGHRSEADMLPELLAGGAKGMSTFMSYYILSSIAQGGEAKQAMDIMKDYYGAMLSRGATTFWEDFNMDWLVGSGRIDELPKADEKDIHGDYGAYCYKGFRHSLCHGWASGPVPFLTETVLGIRDIGIGCNTLIIKPDLCGLEYAKGIYPTPLGVVKVEHRMIDGKIQTEIKAPKGIKIVRE